MDRARAAARRGRLPQGGPAGAAGRRGDGAVLHRRRHAQARGVEPPGAGDDPALRRRDRDGYLVCRVAPADAGTLFDRRGDQGAHRRAADAAVGGVSRAPPRNQAALRIRGDEADVGGDGAYHHAAPARRAGPAVALPEEAPGARRPHPEEGARRLPQPDSGDAFASQAEVRRMTPRRVVAAFVDTCGFVGSREDSFCRNFWRIGFSTNHAISAAAAFISAATTNTACQVPVAATSKLESGTSSDAVPLAVYSRPALAVAYSVP